MAQPTTTFLDELMAAARGCVALLLGRREASSFFDFSQRGLVGSFVALLIAVAFSAFGGMLIGAAPEAGTPTQVAIINILGAGLQIGTAYLLLRQMGRADGLIPYVVTTNWVALATSLALILVSLTGSAALVMLLVVAVASLVVLINTCRLIVTLRPMQIVIFLVVQSLAVMLGLAVLGSMLLDPQTLAAV